MVGLASLAAALTFAASAGHLLTTPGLYGVTYDADVETNTSSASDTECCQQFP